MILSYKFIIVKFHYKFYNLHIHLCSPNFMILCSKEMYHDLPNSSGKGLQINILRFPNTGTDVISEKSTAGIAMTIAKTQIRDAVKTVSGFALKPATWRRIGFTMAQYL